MSSLIPGFRKSRVWGPWASPLQVVEFPISQSRGPCSCWTHCPSMVHADSSMCLLHPKSKNPTNTGLWEQLQSKSGDRMKGMWLPRKIPYPLLFYLSPFVWTFSCGWSLEMIAFTITFSVFPGKDSWKFLWLPAGTLHTAFIVSPFVPSF